MKELLEKFLKLRHPELSEGIHLPAFAVVTAVPDPPTAGEICRRASPKYAVNCRLLNADMDYDSLPELLDVPVCLPGAGQDRGPAALPQPGTVVEVAFAYGRLTMPFIRSALPYNLKLPAIDATSQRWQQSGNSYQQVDGDGNWSRVTDAEIQDVATKLWIGSTTENLLNLVVEFMTSTISAFNTLSTHTHPSVGPISQGAAVAAESAAISGQKTRLSGITK